MPERMINRKKNLNVSIRIHEYDLNMVKIHLIIIIYFYVRSNQKVCFSIENSLNLLSFQ